MAELVCPKCGNAFKGPLLEKKRHGVGFTLLRGLGVVRCPSCGYEAVHKEFTG